MRATSASPTERQLESPPTPPSPRGPRPIGRRFPRRDDQDAARERALSRFVNELSPSAGPEFFQLLVDYIADSLGFDAALIAELPPDADGQLIPIAMYPQDQDARACAFVHTHCARLVEHGLALIGTVPSDAALDLPVIGSDGRLVGMICGFGRQPKVHDDTLGLLTAMLAHRAAAELERQRSLRELERRNALYIGLITSTQEIVGVLDADGAFTTVSPAIERVLGFYAETCVGLPVVDLVHPVDRESVASLLRISGPHGYVVEARLRRTDGSWLTMEVSVADHFDDDGHAIRVLSARDLTNVRRLEDSLRQSRKTEMIGRLATGIAHDFGNILMVVQSHADVMRLRTTEDDPRYSSVDAIEEAVARGADLARQLLAFTRHREAEIKAVDLHAAVEQSAALLRRVVGSSIHLDMRLAPDARYVVADSTQIEQVILNLTLNARDAMPNGGRIVFETSTATAASLPAAVAAAPDDFVCFSVADTGCGIPEHVQPRIFEPLFTTKSDGAGSGIGLSNVHDIVTRHGGFVEVMSQEGAGTRFNVFLRRKISPVARA